ncbi:hypothetical protein EVAR_47225_1 [Eumeta japonica]|uniref:Uncharacterized protein n=1 Tax=Eumeta variegata TaxID=151549 RepID=A0A4C1XR34_EUMVA|nr:hypothetical protein EVAR_47225_1 [Eumeta japonica]
MLEDTFTLLQDLPSESEAALSGMLGAVHDAHDQLAAPHVAHLHNVKHSPRYVDVLTSQLKQKLVLSERSARAAAVAEERRAAALERATQMRPVLARLVEHSKLLQADVFSVAALGVGDVGDRRRPRA